VGVARQPLFVRLGMKGTESDACQSETGPLTGLNTTQFEGRDILKITIEPALIVIL
jgi:hypothetical protein